MILDADNVKFVSCYATCNLAYAEIKIEDYFKIKMCGSH